MTVQIDVTIEELSLNVGPRNFQSRLYYPDRPGLAGAVLIAPPHPYLGGNIDNNVLKDLGSALAAEGFAVLTYNLPGVGKSSPRAQPEFSRDDFWSDPQLGPDAERDARDYICLMDALQKITGVEAEPCAAVGYSYGAAIALMAAQSEAFSCLTLISPPLPQIAGGLWERATDPTLLLFAEDDIAAESSCIQDIKDRDLSQLTVETIQGADHFYIDRLQDVSRMVIEFFSKPQAKAVVQSNEAC